MQRLIFWLTLLEWNKTLKLNVLADTYFFTNTIPITLVSLMATGCSLIFNMYHTSVCWSNPPGCPLKACFPLYADGYYKCLSTQQWPTPPRPTCTAGPAAELWRWIRICPPACSSSRRCFCILPGLWSGGRFGIWGVQYGYKGRKISFTISQ